MNQKSTEQRLDAGFESPSVPASPVTEEHLEPSPVADDIEQEETANEQPKRVNARNAVLFGVIVVSALAYLFMGGDPRPVDGPVQPAMSQAPAPDTETIEESDPQPDFGLDGIDGAPDDAQSAAVEAPSLEVGQTADAYGFDVEPPAEPLSLPEETNAYSADVASPSFYALAGSLAEIQSDISAMSDAHSDVATQVGELTRAIRKLTERSEQAPAHLFVKAPNLSLNQTSRAAVNCADCVAHASVTLAGKNYQLGDGDRFMGFLVSVRGDRLTLTDPADPSITFSYWPVSTL